ncbi:serine/threonine-protein kinase VRK1 isoform X3 [Pantherophis guttatus]|uniref:non-specific serine/threonine protein kinase n=1 Tax=Pantherophis guttatus TaxID=94885 RepID=A0A6P9BSJ4_PANGU|nr:serine/threonine-protein kinase VRK1 isoform X3 [Pantherophis guttatus]
MTMPNIKKSAGKRGPRKRKLAEEFPPGEVFTDLLKKKWKLGPVIGKGGFGCLYLADVNSSESVTSDAPYVIKVEPSDNGPLFTELSFYMRAAKPELIKKWISSHKLKYLGVPKYWGSGLHQKNGKSYRFMVMDRFGKDLQKIFEEQGKQFSRKTVLQLGLRILNVLEYIHEHEYVHGDIKASNLLLGHEIPNQVYLVDYGLAFRYSPEGNHKDYKENPKRCHDGTLEFTSIDAHKGASPSRRGDLEILGYCMICWLSGSLPWEDNLKNPDYVKESKIRYTDNVSEFMLKCFTKENKPESKTHRSIGRTWISKRKTRKKSFWPPFVPFLPSSPQEHSAGLPNPLHILFLRKRDMFFGSGKQQKWDAGVGGSGGQKQGGIQSIRRTDISTYFFWGGGVCLIARKIWYFEVSEKVERKSNPFCEQYLFHQHSDAVVVCVFAGFLTAQKRVINETISHEIE